MLIVKLWNYFKGYVIIRIEGFALEKFLNLLVKEEIFVWDIIRESNTCIYAKVSKRNFVQLKKIIKKVSCRIEIIDKKGIPFWLLKMKKRKFLVIGATLALVAIYFLTSFIWTIEVMGNEKVSTNSILRQLKEVGVQEGEWKYKFDEEELENHLLFTNEEFNYAKINFVGTKVKVEVVEREELPPEENTSTPTRVIAQRDGIVQKVLAYGGVPVVQEGDFVQKGDLLINGEIQSPEEIQENEEDQEDEKSKPENNKVHAWGDVYAKTWYELEVDVSLKAEEKRDESQGIEKRSLVIGSKEFTLKKVVVPYQNYDKIEETTPIIDWMGLEVPIYIKNTRYYPKEQSKKLTNQDIKEQALQGAQKKIEEEREQEIEIINHTMEIINKDGNSAKVKIFIEASEQIGEIEKIK